MENPTLVPTSDQKFLLGESVAAVAPNGFPLVGTVSRADDTSFLVTWAPNIARCSETMYLRTPAAPEVKP